MCFPGRALSNDLMNLFSFAFMNESLGFGAGIYVRAFCFAIK